MNVEKKQRAQREARRTPPETRVAAASDPRWPNGCPNPYLEAAMVEDEGTP